MLRTTPKRPSERPWRTRGRVMTASAAVVIVTGVVGLAGCGGSSSTTKTPTISVPSADQAAVAAYQKAGNGICAAQMKATAGIDARMKAAEKANQRPSLADTTALNNALASEAAQLAKLTPPAPYAQAHAQLTSAFQTYVARAQQLLKQYGNASIAYDATDSKLLADSSKVVAKLTELGLTTCK
jgi:hypothetical protein